MSDQDPHQIAFSDSLDEQHIQEMAAHRPISRLALIAVALGCLSILSIFHNVLWVIPVVGVAISAMAYRKTSAADAVFTGRRAAVLGLGLSLLFASLAVTKNWMVRRTISHQATEFAERWIDIVHSGNLPQATEWMRPPPSRLNPGYDLATFYATNEDAQDYLGVLTKSQTVKRIQQLGDSKVPTCLGLDSYFQDGNKFFLAVRFQLPDQKEGTNPLFVCSVRRTVRDGQTHWTLSDIFSTEVDSEED